MIRGLLRCPLFYSSSPSVSVIEVGAINFLAMIKKQILLPSLNLFAIHLVSLGREMRLPMNSWKRMFKNMYHDSGTMFHAPSCSLLISTLQIFLTRLKEIISPISILLISIVDRVLNYTCAKCEKSDCTTTGSAREC